MQNKLSGATHFLRRDSAWLMNNRESARQFVSGFKGDPVAMKELRELVGASEQRYDLSRLTDEQVIEIVARLMAQGEVLVGREWHSALAAGRGGQPGPAEAPGAPAEARRVPAGPQAAQQDLPTWGPGLHGAMQAAALAGAAQNGAPFCDI